MNCTDGGCAKRFYDTSAEKKETEEQASQEPAENDKKEDN